MVKAVNKDWIPLFGKWIPVPNKYNFYINTRTLPMLEAQNTSNLWLKTDELFTIVKYIIVLEEKINLWFLNLFQQVRQKNRNSAKRYYYYASSSYLWYISIPVPGTTVQVGYASSLVQVQPGTRHSVIMGPHIPPYLSLPYLSLIPNSLTLTPG